MSASINEDHQLNITDPIGLSLSASISDEHTAYRHLDKPRRDDFFDAKTLDVWLGARGPYVLNHNYPLSRDLPNHLFEASHHDAPPDARLIVRLLVTRPAPAGNQLAWHDDLAKFGHKQINYLPFVPDAMHDLIDQWDLPRSWTGLRLNAREVGNFSRKTEWDSSVNPPVALRMGVVINFPFVLRPSRQLDYLTEAKGGKTAGRRKANSDYNPWRDDPFIWSLAMSHSLRDGKSRGLLDGVTDWAFDDISRRILTPDSRSYQHPLHIPWILLQIVFDHAAWEINRLAIDVSEFEDLSKDAETSSLEKFDAITTQLQYLRRSLDFQQHLTDFLSETMKYLEEKVFRSSDDLRRERSGYAAFVVDSNPQVEERLTNLSYLIKNNLDTVKYLQARTKDALDYINGAISLRDNEANKEDADSNKTMSFLQMTFLPATAVAAIFSMNVFDWTHNPPAVYPSFWVFWVVAIILTLIVLGVYFGAKRYARLKDEREKQEADEKENHEQQMLQQSPVPDQNIPGNKAPNRRKNGSKRRDGKSSSNEKRGLSDDNRKNQTSRGPTMV